MSEVQITLADLLVEVARKHGFHWKMLGADSRSAAIINARHEFFFRALGETQKSAGAIGNYCNTVHGTVLYGATKHAVVNNLPLARGSKAYLKELIRFRPDYNPTQKGKENEPTKDQCADATL